MSLCEILHGIVTMETATLEKTKSAYSTIEGKWYNSYGSLLTIHPIHPSGYFSGTYESTTGSVGKYLVSGYADNSTPHLENRLIALTIHWKSILGGVADPSWHWVSAMNGQFFFNDRFPSIKFLHGMTASSPFPDAGVQEPGVYTESLVYTRIAPESFNEDEDESAGLSCQHLHTIAKVSSPKEVLGDYINVDSNSLFTIIENLTVASDKVITGRLLYNDESQSTPIVGWCDEKNSTLDLRSIAFAASYIHPVTSELVTVSFTGFIDKQNNNQMKVETFIAHKTTEATKYTTVSISSNTFTKFEKQGA